MVIACILAVGRFADEPEERSLERIAGWWVWGCAILSAVFSILGHLTFTAATLTLAASLLAAAAVWRRRDADPLHADWHIGSLGKIDGCILALFAIHAVLALLGTLTPEVRHDPLFYHLQIPRLWLNFGRIVEVPENGHSYFPYGMEVLYAWCLGLGSDSAAKGLHWGSGIALALMTSRLARALGARPLHAAALVYFMPIMMYLSTTTYIDLATGMYAVAAITLLFSDEITPRRAASFGFLLGSSLATKYTAWPLVGIPLFAALVWRVRFDPTRLAPALLAAALPVSPWVLRNIINVGNPVAPLLVGLFGPETAHATGLAGSFDSFAGGALDPQRLVLAPLTYAHHLLINKYPLSVLGIASAAALWWMRSRTPATQAPGLPAHRVHPAVLLLAMFLVESIATRGHPDGRYALASLALGGVIVCVLCGRLGMLQPSGRCIIAPVLALVMGVSTLFDARRLQNQLCENWTSPLLTAESRNRYLADRGVIAPDQYEIEAALDAEGAGRVLGIGYPSRQRYWIWIQGMRNDLVPEPMPFDVDDAVHELYRALLRANVTHIVREANPRLPDEVWNAFLARHTEPVEGVPIRRILRPGNPALI